ncbi:hypothetical protein F4808DRAFT_366643 [Astrocystis sublimbata]|nr:hypothetical protein F4808DRAFT_366643 [Astrocystis sublimbata]
MASPYDGVDLDTIPVRKPPPGVVSNFVNPPTQEEIPKIFIYVTLPPMLVFLALRIYSRIRYTRLGLDDALCILSAIAIIGHIALSFASLGNPAGPHIWDIPVSRFTAQYIQFSIAQLPIYLAAALLIKTSILVLYQRLFNPSRLANILIWAGIVLVVLFYTVSIVIFVAFCVPRAEDYAAGGWLSPLVAARCFTVDAPISIAQGAVGTFTDAYILVIPLICLSRLHTTTKRKAGLLAIFAVGTAALAFSIAGVYYRSQIVQNMDLTWKNMPIIAVNTGEINVGIISSCMPVVFVLLRGFTDWCASCVSKLRPDTRNNRIPKEVEFGHRHDEMLGCNTSSDEDQDLPTPPKGALTGLKAIMRNFNRTKPAKTQTTNLVSSLTYVSVDYDYHAQLKRQLSAPRGTRTGEESIISDS